MKKLITLLPFIFFLASCSSPETVEELIYFNGNYRYIANDAPMAPKADVGLTFIQSGEIVKAAVNDSGTTYFLELYEYGFEMFGGSTQADGKNIELRIYQSNGEVWGFYLVSFEDQSKNYGFISKLEKR